LDLEDDDQTDIVDPDAKPTEEENLWKAGEGLNFLVNLYQYINLRFITAPSRCLICDRG